MRQRHHQFAWTSWAVVLLLSISLSSDADDTGTVGSVAVSSPERTGFALESEIVANSGSPDVAGGNLVEQAKEILRKWREENMREAGAFGAAGESSEKRAERLKLLNSWRSGETCAGDRSAAGRGPDCIAEQIRRENDELVEFVRSIKEWEDGFTLGASKGRVDEMITRAEAFEFERQYRRALQHRIQSLVKLFELWLVAGEMRIAEKTHRIDEILELLEAARKKTTASEKAEAPSRPPLDQFQYYQVKKTAGLRAISALPEVYGAAERWEILLDANSDKIKDVSDAVPAGTVLIVPNVEASREFNF